MKIEGKLRGQPARPLERLALTVAPTFGTLVVRDGHAREYFRAPASPSLYFTVGGALGTHTIILEDDAGRARQQLTFPVTAETRIADAGGRYDELLRMLEYTMVSEFGERSTIRYRGRIYRFFISWLRDHVHVAKGMKYFSGVEPLKDGIDLYRNSQRADRMIWDNVRRRTREPNHWDMRFKDGDYIQPFDDFHGEFKRIPVENDVEYLFVEGLYYAWKAVGDDGWMAGSLDAAIRALEYSVTDRVRWSTKYKLLKRGYTIDTWDFQSDADAVVNHDGMRIDPDRTRFGVMFGDNTGYVAACRYLAEMLDHVGRTDEAGNYRARAEDMKRRLDALAWNGRFYTHHVRENPAPEIDFGVDESSQVSLSNAYSLNRGLTHEQAAAIIRTYQNIKAHLPEGSPGEWYTIYPPFERGYDGHGDKWQYMNASVTPIVAGELARGAFEHGFESYGADILDRLIDLGKRHGGRFHCSYTGSMPEAPPPREFTPIDLSSVANADFHGAGAPGVPGWIGDPENDLREMVVGDQKLADIDFRIIDPASNGRRAAIVLATKEGYAKRVEVPVGGRTAGSIYFLHGCSRPGNSGMVGTVTLAYADGTTHLAYIVQGKHVSGWWHPEAPKAGGRKNGPNAAVAWTGKNAVANRVGLIAWGLDNPHPAKPIDRITLDAAADGAFWMIAGISLSDRAAYFPQSPISFGIPNGWGAAAVVYALVEGLAGVVDEGVAYDRAQLAPRWPVAGVDQAEATITYPASGGYVAYRYRHDAASKRIELELTGNGTACDCHVLLPSGAGAADVSVDGKRVESKVNVIESSRYADFTLDASKPKTVAVAYR